VAEPVAAACELARELLIADRTAAPAGEGLSYQNVGGNQTGYNKSDTRPIISRVTQAMLSKFGALVNGRIDVFVEDGLGEASSVAQVDENHGAMIAPPVDPSHQEDRLARVGGAQLAAAMSTAKLA